MIITLMLANTTWKPRPFSLSCVLGFLEFINVNKIPYVTVHTLHTYSIYQRHRLVLTLIIVQNEFPLHLDTL